MNTQELSALLDRLCAEPREAEWLEFKSNRYDAHTLGKYLSALANSACLLGKLRAYLVFGIENSSHAVIGTTFDPLAETAKGKDGKNNQLLPLWLSLHLQPNTGYEIHPFEEMKLVEGRYPNLVVAAAIAAATDQKARHIRDKGFDNAYYRDLILKIVHEHQPVSREDIDRLLLDKLPEVLSREQKLSRIHNLLNSLSGKRIHNQGTRHDSQWVLIEDNG